MNITQHPVIITDDVITRLYNKHLTHYINAVLVPAFLHSFIPSFSLILLLHLHLWCLYLISASLLPFNLATQWLFHVKGAETERGVEEKNIGVMKGGRRKPERSDGGETRRRWRWGGRRLRRRGEKRDEWRKGRFRSGLMRGGAGGGVNMMKQ